MERRCEDRLAVNQPVRLTVLEEFSPSPASIDATITNLSSGGFQVYASSPVAAGKAVRVDLPLDGKQALLLGEVRYCQPEGNRFGLGVSLEHSILDLTGLERLRVMLEQADRVSELAEVEAA